jgi:hypothetical protein
MLYLPIKKLKIYSIIFCALVCLQLIFYASKTYTVSQRDLPISNVNEEIYLSYLSSAPSLSYKTDIINDTEIRYFYILPEYSLLILYIGYFLVAMNIILSGKIKLNE